MSMIHVLGLGSIGSLIAHTLRFQGLPVTLLVRDSAMAQYNSEWQLSVESPTGSSSDAQVSSGYLFESSETPIQYKSHIKTLIVCTKAYDSAVAVSKILARLDPHSTVLLLNNGLGVYDQVRQTIIKQRHLQQVDIGEAFLSHGVYRTGTTAIKHVGKGAFLLASANPTAVSQDILQSLARSLTPLSAEFVRHSEFQLKQIIKLLVNATINPITAITRHKNGIVYEYIPLVEAIIAESLSILKAKFVLLTLEVDEVLESVLEVATKTAENQSSMLQDIRSGKPTEIDFMNGYLVKLAKEMTIPAIYNQALTQIVHELVLGKDVTDLWLGLLRRSRNDI